MTTFAPKRDDSARHRELDELTHTAWTVYSDGLRDLTGREYDEAEHESWEHLQDELRELDAERAELVAATAARAPAAE